MEVDEQTVKASIEIRENFGSCKDFKGCLKIVLHA